MPGEVDQVAGPCPFGHPFGIGQKIARQPAALAAERHNLIPARGQRGGKVPPDQPGRAGDEDAAPGHTVIVVSGTAVTKRVPPLRRSASCLMTSAFRFQGRISTKSGCTLRR